MSSAEQTRDSNYSGTWGFRLGFGRSPALVIIDYINAYVTEGAALYAEGAMQALQPTARLLRLCREARIPVMHTTILVTPPDFADAGIWALKAPVLRELVADNPLSAFCAEVAPIPGELVFTKQYPSAFFGTGLASALHVKGIDTLLIAGCSTSGCVRASAVDAMQHGFRPMVVEECCGDRHPDPHRANLFDINAKYGDVVALDEVETYLADLATQPEA